VLAAFSLCLSGQACAGGILIDKVWSGHPVGFELLVNYHTREPFDLITLERMDTMTNHTLSYARSWDSLNWETSTGRPILRPIRMANGEVIDPAKPSAGEFLHQRSWRRALAPRRGDVGGHGKTSTRDETAIHSATRNEHPVSRPGGAKHFRELRRTPLGVALGNAGAES
jgi:hypothetical protein